jgi:hypothetical protein
MQVVIFIVQRVAAALKIVSRRSQQARAKDRSSLADPRFLSFFFSRIESGATPRLENGAEKNPAMIRVSHRLTDD